MMKMSRTAERGSALLLCLIILVVVTGISGAYLSFSLINQKKTYDDMYALQSLYIAEAGANVYLQNLNSAGNAQTPSPRGIQTIALQGVTLQEVSPGTTTQYPGLNHIELAGGSYVIPVEVDYGTDGVDNDGDGAIDNQYEQGFRRVVVEGTFSNVTRKVEIILSRTAGGVFWNAIFAGNNSGDTNYDLYLGGSNKNQYDLVHGDVYSGGSITTDGYAQLLNGNGGTSPNAEAMYADSYTDSSSTNVDPNFVQGTQSSLLIPEGDSNSTISRYEERAKAGLDGYIDVAGHLQKFGSKGMATGTKSLGEAELQILDVDEPAHLFRLNPATNGFSVGTSGKDRTVNYGNVDTAKDDYYMEDPTTGYKSLTLPTAVNGSKQAHVNKISPPSNKYATGGNDQVYFIDGNFWASHNGILNFKFEKPDPTQAMAMTVVVKGNVNFTDNILYQDNKMDGIAIIAIEDPSYPNTDPTDFQSNSAKLPNGQTVAEFLKVAQSNNPSMKIDPANNPADRGRASQEYNRAFGSGNVFYGDPASGTVDYFEGYMYAQNNFYATGISVSGNQTSRVHIYGNMTAGNHVALERNTTNGYKALEVILDPKIKNGQINLPDLPETPGTGDGDWFIASWKQIP